MAHNPLPNSGTFSGQTPAVTSAQAINYAARSLSQTNKGHWISLHVPKTGGRPQKSTPQTMEHRQTIKPPHSARVQPSAINSRAFPLPRSTNHPLCPGQTPAARHIVRTAILVRPNRTLRSARKPSRHTCGKLHECLSFYYLSPNCAAPFKSMPKPMSSCTSPNRQLSFRQNASAETFRNTIVRSPANAIILHI